MGKTKVSKRPTPQHWASWIPFGWGEQHPNNFAEVFRALWENRDQASYAWRILTEGVCDGCALGTTGLKDWTLDGVHLCNIRLRLLRLNTQPALDVTLLQDVKQFITAGRLPKGQTLRQLGRLPLPLVRHKGDKGFTPLSWDEALDLIAAKMKQSRPERWGFFLTSRGIPNEIYYGVQKAVRALGTNSVDNAARLCHAPSTVGLKTSLGVGATTCSYSDWFAADLITFFGSNVANNQPVATKYLHYAKKNGAKIVTLNTYREPGMEAYWIPSVPESALFGTKITDHFQLIHMGGDIAFINGTLKHLFANGWVDNHFIEQFTDGIYYLRAELEKQSWEELENASGATRQEMLTYAELIHQAKKAVFVWSMGVTQHSFGADVVKAIINLALTKGFVGRPGCGLMPIRGHSGVQGGAEMGAYATVLPGGLPITPENAQKLSEQWGFTVPAEKGKTAPEMIDEAYKGKLDVLFAIGGNFLEVLPEPVVVEEALRRVPLRVHMDIVLSPQMFVDPAETVLLLPATTRYEIPGGVTETTTERRVIFSPEIAGPTIGQTRPESDVLADLVARVKPELAEKVRFASLDEMRQEIGRVIPFYAGIEQLHKAGDQFQYGGEHLCADWHFPTPNGKAYFQPIKLPHQEIPAGYFRVTTRRGKQFNTIVHEAVDSLNGAEREAVLINPADMNRLGLHKGQKVLLINEVGEMFGTVFPAAVTPGNLQIHWPEGNVLIQRGRYEPTAGIPDYTALVKIEKI